MEIENISNDEVFIDGCLIDELRINCCSLYFLNINNTIIRKIVLTNNSKIGTIIANNNSKVHSISIGIMNNLSIERISCLGGSFIETSFFEKDIPKFYCKGGMIIKSFPHSSLTNKIEIYTHKSIEIKKEQ